MTRTFWRLSVSDAVAAAFQGTRGRGRWNTPATHPVYAAGSVALAALERLLYAQFDRGMEPSRSITCFASRFRMMPSWIG